MKEGDILMFSDGDSAMVRETDFPCDGYTQLQFISEREHRSVDLSSLRHVVNYEDDTAARVTFHMVRSIHLRLNSLSKV